MTEPAGPLVLVVEDYQDAREMYAAYLQFSGFRVAEATNGLEAIEKTLELCPDIILMDLALPKMDGWEATRRLKMDERTRHIPVVALTGHALAGHAEGARQAGCDSFVTKPCLPDAHVAESAGQGVTWGRESILFSACNEDSNSEIRALGSLEGNAHVHWHVVPLPPRIPYEEQQLAALDWDRTGVLELDDREQADLADRVRKTLQNRPDRGTDT